MTKICINFLSSDQISVLLNICNKYNIRSSQGTIKMLSREKNREKVVSAPKYQNRINHTKQNNESIIVIKYQGLHAEQSIIPIVQRQSLRKNINQNQKQKFQNVLSSEPKGRFSRLSQARQSAIRVYEKDKKNTSIKQPAINRLTFGPQNFKTKQKEMKIESQRQQNPQLIMPITHSKQNKSRSSSKLSSIQDSKIRPKLLQIMQKQLKMSESTIKGLKEQTLNYELQKFVKKKGLQYLQENHQRNYRAKTQGTSNNYLPIQPVFISSKSNKSIKKNQAIVEKPKKYPNYIPEVFPKIQKKKSSKKTIVSVATQQQKKNPEKTKPKNKNEAKIYSLNDRQEMLGKIVYDKVQDYFKLNQQKANYYSRVKSEQKIDEAWIQYLKTKIDRADLVLKQKV